jgi:hypothetical protein
MDGAGQALVAVTMVSNQIAPRAEVTEEAPAEEETLPESELPTAWEPTTATKAAFTDIQIPTGADVGTADEDVNIINLDPSEITPAVPEDVRKSPKEKRKKKRRRSTQQETDGRLVIRFKTAGSARPNE